MSSPAVSQTLRIDTATPLLRVPDVKLSAEWYRDVLGFQIDPFPAEPPYRFAILVHGEVEIMLTEGPVPARSSGWDVYLRVSCDMRELHRSMTEQGLVKRSLQKMFYGLCEFDVADPNGYVLCLSGEVQDTSGIPSPA
jgi:uncharacterized glyoxalase superfamily protein PhnB